MEVITESEFNDANDVASTLCDSFDRIKSNSLVKIIVDRFLSDAFGDFRQRLIQLFVADLLKRYKSLGYDLSYLYSNLYLREGAPLFIVENTLVTNTHITYEGFVYDSNYKPVINSLDRFHKSIQETWIQQDDDFFYIDRILEYLNLNNI